MRFNWIASAILCFVLNNTNAQNFFRSYGNVDDEVARSVVETDDSSFFIFGSTSSFYEGSSDFYLLHIDSTGAYIQSKVYGGNDVEQGHSIGKKPNGNFLLTGYSNSYGNGYEIMNLEIDNTGNEIWRNTYGGTDWDFAYDNTILPGGDAIITGSTYSIGNGNQDGFLMMIDNNGDSLWIKSYGNTAEDVLRKTIYTSSGHLVSIGYTTTAAGDRDFYLVKTNMNGDTIWTKHYGSSFNDEGFSLCEAKNGRYILCGYTEANAGNGKDGYYFETDTSGNMTWFQFYGASGEDIFNSICVKPNESRIFTAWETTSFGNGGSDFVMNTLYSAGGWNSYVNTFGTAMDEIPYDVIFTSNKRILAVGKTNSPYGNTNVMAVLSDTTLPMQSTMTNYVDINSISEIQENHSFHFYPNPANDVIYLMGDSRLKDIIILDLAGKVVLRKENETFSLDVSELPAAAYLIKAEFENGEISQKKLIVTRQ